MSVFDEMRKDVERAQELRISNKIDYNRIINLYIEGIHEERIADIMEIPYEDLKIILNEIIRTSNKLKEIRQANIEKFRNVSTGLGTVREKNRNGNGDER